MIEIATSPVLSTIRHQPDLRISLPVADCGTRQFPTLSPIYELYRFTCSQPTSLEGVPALQGTLNLVQWYRERGIDRVHERSMHERLESLLEWSAQLFDSIPSDVDAVVWNGSFLRGRPDASDVDMKILTLGGEENPLSDCFDSVENEIEKRVRLAVANAGLPNSLCGVPIKDGEQFICSQYDPLYGPSVKLVEQGPFLCLVRPEVPGGPMGTLCYPSGVGYLTRRDKPYRI